MIPCNLTGVIIPVSSKPASFSKDMTAFFTKLPKTPSIEPAEYPLHQNDPWMIFTMLLCGNPDSI